MPDSGDCDETGYQRSILVQTVKDLIDFHTQHLMKRFTGKAFSLFLNKTLKAVITGLILNDGV